jgi:hypothetical protein
VQGTSNPTGFLTFSSFFGVSCRSTTCIGVGWSAYGLEIDSALAELKK